MIPGNANAIFREIQETFSYPIEIRYFKLYQLLNRLCIDASGPLHSDFSGLFSRLYAVCRYYHIDHRPADRFRRHARLVLWKKAEAEEDIFQQDVCDLAIFVAALYKEPLPDAFKRTAVRSQVSSSRPLFSYLRLRVVVSHIDKERFSCVPVQTSQGDEIIVDYSNHPALTGLLEEAMQLNLLNIEKVGNVYKADYIILEPDFLVDVSSLTACCRPFGAHPFNYLLSKFAPREMTRSILLGNAANCFMDDCIYETKNAPADFKISIRRHFQESLLDYAATSDEIDRSYFDDARRHFENIRSTVQGRFPSPEIGILSEDALLEPTFICEALGLRGRFDVMTTDHRRLVELKSGRAEEFGLPQPRPRQEHVLQMALYKEMLHYNFGLPYEKIDAFLFYSRYPLLFNERSSAEAIHRILDLRNAIVHQERILARGGFRQLLPSFTAETINSRRLNNKLYYNYLLPSIQAVVEPLQKMTSLERDYFCAFLTFLEREQFVAKTSDNRPDSNRSFASLWTADLSTKMASGDILPRIVLRQAKGETALETLVFSLPDYGEDFVPNFTPGEMVLLYEYDEENAGVTNRQLFRAYIQEISDKSLVLSLLYKQKNKKILAVGKTYAIEHDSSDAVFSQAYRNLHALLTATPRRRALLLAQRQPEIGPERPLSGHFQGRVAEVVSRAKRADDYYILVGPPGTGKTSVYLRAMVEEFLLSHAAGGDGPASLLLTAYTNRAVDEICAMLENIQMPFAYVRIGAEQTCHPRFRKRLLSSRSDLSSRREVRQFLASVPVVVGTVTTLTSQSILFSLKQFDVAIVDEASQILEPQLLGLLAARHGEADAIRRFVMVGDHKQLPAVVALSPGQTQVTEPSLLAIGLSDLRNSLFERLHGLLRRWKLHQLVDELDRQGRMHAEIGAFASRLFYGGRLLSVPQPHQEAPLPFRRYDGALEAFVATTRMGFVDVAPPQSVANNKCNEHEAEAVAALVASLLSVWEKNGISTQDAGQRIGIIVPFRNQIAAIRRALARRCQANIAGMTIDTVECFQGSQRDVIIFSTTISQPYQLGLISVASQTENGSVDRKLNVALTRARLQMFTVGNAALLSGNPYYAQLVAYCRRFNARPDHSS